MQTHTTTSIQGDGNAVLSGQFENSTVNITLRSKDDATALTGLALDHWHLRVCKEYFLAPDSEQKFYGVESFESANWLFRQEAFQKWQSLGVTEAKKASPALLGIQGNAFTGKTAMMKKAIERSLDDKNVITLYHFFGHAATDPIATLLRDLLGQLLHDVPNKPWDHIRRWGGNIQAKRLGEVCSRIELQKAFKDIILANKEALNANSIGIRTFIDGVDECRSEQSLADEDDSKRVTDMLEFFASLLKSALDVGVDLGICVSGRHFPDELLTTMIDLRPYTDEEIGVLLRRKLQFLEDPMQVLRLLYELSERGAHNFYWANAIGYQVKKYSTNFDGLKILAAKVLDNHEALYRSALRSSQTSPNHHNQLPLLQVALGTFRTLTAEEFRHAYALAANFDPYHTSMLAWEKSDQGVSAAAFKNFLLDATGGILEVVTRIKRSRYAMNDQEAAEDKEIEHHILFLHRSTESFLRSEKGLEELRIESRSHLEKDCHLLLFKICAFALDRCMLNGKDDVHVLDYACEFWLPHSRMCGELPGDLKLPRFMEKCTGAKARRFIEQQIKLLCESNKEESTFLRDQTSMMILLSTLGCTALLRKHLEVCKYCQNEVSAIVHAEQPSETYLKSLSNAIMAAKFETAKYLLDFLPEEHLNIRINDWTLLYKACFFTNNSGSEYKKGLDLIKSLLNRGADPRISSNTTEEFPLHFAIAAADHSLLEVICEGREPEVLEDLFEIAQWDTERPALHFAITCELADPGERVAILRTLQKLAPDPAKLLQLGDVDSQTPWELAEDDPVIMEELEYFE